MNRSDVEAARAEAVRFIGRCDELLATIVDQYDGKTGGYVERPWRSTDNTPTKQAAACARSSLDLTRALAHMRRRR